MKFVELNERFYSELIVTSNCFAKKDLPISSATLEWGMKFAYGLVSLFFTLY